MVTKTDGSSLTWDQYDKNGVLIESSVSTTTSVVQDWNVPALVRGTWITYPSGFRFRRPTAYNRYSLILRRGSPLSMRETRLLNGAPYRVYDYISSAGANVNNFFSGNWVNKLGSTIGVVNIRGAPTIPEMERNEAVTKSLNKMADNKVNLGEGLATLGQTSRMLISPIRSFTDLAKAYHRLPFTTDGRGKVIPWAELARKSYRDLIRGGTPARLADKYLEYVYGFKPLMQDIYEISEMLKESARHPLLLNSRGSASRTTSTSELYERNTSARQEEYWSDIVSESKTRVTLWAKLKDEYALTRTLNQLGLLNPASLVWELVPFSFVIDWALPIGPVLNAMTAPAGLDFVGGSVSRRLSASWQYRIERQRLYTSISGSPATGQMAYEGYRRETITSWPRPGLWFNPDPLGLANDGSDRLFKGLALAVARMPRSL